MKRYFFVALLFLLGIFLTPVHGQEYAEYISEFNSEIVVNRDATIDIVEEITYHLPEGKRGIFWQLPVSYEAFGFKRNTGFKLNDLYYYPKDNPDVRKSVYERGRSSGWVEIRIGEEDVFISGDYVYVIDYTLRDVGFTFFEDRDEVFINIIGPGWQVPILNSTATITLPEEPDDMICYVGKEGSDDRGCTIVEDDNVLTITTNESLLPFEAFTFAISYPKGVLEDNTLRVIMGLILSNIGLLLPIPVGIFLFRKLKKDWKNKKITVIPHYEAPNDLDPLLGSYIYSLKHDNKGISAIIIWMAVKGYISIERDGKKMYITKEVDSIEENRYISDMFDSIFSKEEKVKLGKMPSSFTLKLPTLLSTLETFCKNEEYISKSRLTSKSSLSSIGSFLIFGGLFFLLPILIDFAAIGTAFGVIISAILLVIVSKRIDIRGKKGNELYYELLGLKMYIDTAEKHRIEFHNDPEKFRGVFETLLPFAIVFGLEKKWVKEFGDLYKETQPDWYRGNFNTFDALMITSAVSTLNRGVNSATRAAYGSSSGYRSSSWSSGGSGFSGGGAGGGGGGSGGGSW